MKKIFSVFFLLAFATAGLCAQDAGWRLDKAHSKIVFTVKHMVISEVLGYFKDFDITFNSSKGDFTDGQVEVVIKVSSINTGNETRDKDLRSDSYFGADEFPEIRFKNTKFEKTGDNTYKIYGDLTIRDVTKPVIFDAVHNGTLKTKRGIMSAWKATLAINRFDYGIKSNSVMETGGLVVGETVNVTITLELRKPVS